MTPQEQRAYLGNLGDEALKEALRTAAKDLEKAADTQRNSDWHGACFAATVLFAQELNRRGLKLNATH